MRVPPCHKVIAAGLTFAALTAASVCGSPASAQGSTAITFINSGQQLGLGVSFSQGLDDIDGDNDLDLFLANFWTACKVWKNNGSGTFTNTGQNFGTTSGHGIDLGDLDGDGDLDAFLVFLEGSGWVLFNDGTGRFTDSGQRLGSAADHQGYVTLADLDGDLDLDAAVLGLDVPNLIWLNNGAGVFSAGSSIGDSTSREMALGDLDADEDVDIFMRVAGSGCTVWLNNGSGTFTDTGQTLGETDSGGEIQVGDLDGDGDLDAFVANDAHGGSVWLNDGAAHFTAGKAYPDAGTERIALGDIEGDGDLDAFTTNYLVTNKVWLNDGAANFTPVDSLFGTGAISVTPGDLDGDGDLDVVVGRLDGYGPTSVCFNTTPSAGVRQGAVKPSVPLIWLSGPNPFTSIAQIHYRVPASGPVSLRVVDVLGREVLTLARGTRPAGEYSVPLDGSALRSGTYFCRMEVRSGGAVAAATTKVTLVR